MSFPVGIIPELISIVVGLISSVTFLRASRVFRRYAIANSELGKIEALEKASDELSELRRKAELDPDDVVFRDEQLIGEILERVSDVVVSDGNRLDNVSSALKEVGDILDNKSSKVSNKHIAEVRSSLERMQPFLDRRNALSARIRDDLDGLKKALSHLNLDKF
ncbi:hypothetical protein [Neorhizobium tomejilense]|uniref:hypothetical protein n=1 Tax=Neorhizobium tomejilense TaxID=2093828 RepID=UPI003ECF2E65